jgi:hypothetical protein
MTTRTNTETVTFQHPFRLSGTDEVQPAGQLSRVVDLDPAELAAALATDAKTPIYRLP